MAQDKEKQTISTAGASDNSKTALRRREVKALAPFAGEAQGEQTGNQNRKRKRRRNNTKRPLYEVDNQNLPEGMPPVAAFLPDWKEPPKSVPQKLIKSEPENGEKQSGQRPNGQSGKKKNTVKEKKTNRATGAKESGGETQPQKGKDPTPGKGKSVKTRSRGKKADIEPRVGRDPKEATKKVGLFAAPPSASTAETSALGKELLGILEQSGVPMRSEELIESVNANPKDVYAALETLLANGHAFFTRKQKIGLASHLGYLTGKLQTTGRGFGFMISKDDKADDVYIAQNARAGALNGDTVVVRLVEGRGHAREGEIVGIQAHGNENVVGTLCKDEVGFYLQPDNARIDMQFRLEKKTAGGAKVGQKVVATLAYDGKTPVPFARVAEVLGYSDDAGIDVLSIIRQYDIAAEFPKNAANAAKRVPQEVSRDDIILREDLRKLRTVTIDGPDAKDFDDAISCEKLSDGTYLLGVHIADVAHYVTEGSVLDKEAYDRATSVYFIDRVIPMLPEALSNGICSLNPKVDRLALSCFMQIDANGAVMNHRIAESVINSNERLVYDDVTAALNGDKGLRKQMRGLMPMLKTMQELSDVLAAQREKRGSLDFELPEARIKVDESGKPAKIDINERGIANRMIESFMLAANETVAQHMFYLERPMMYRVHETPDRDKMEELNTFIGGYGLSIRGDKANVRPKTLQSVLKKLEGKPEERVVSRVMLRSLKKARYSEEGLGHFGLAAQFYCHFTSPIRRYPDLIVHRILKEMLHGQLGEERAKALAAKLPEMAQHCSERERRAMEAERAVDDLKKCEYMAQHIGEVFDGVISGVTNFGLFVELPNTCEGLVRMADLTDDYYYFDEKKYRVVGRRTNKTYMLGDEVSVEVMQADINARRVDFTMHEAKAPKGRRPRKKKTA